MSSPHPLPDIADIAEAVLEVNDQGDYTIPAEGVYPHQWLWDSCFIAIGWRHIDIVRAQTEILSLLRGQWANGMIPHMIFSGDNLFHQDRNLWRSWLSPQAPDDVATSGITQPPMLAEAIVRIGQILPATERRTWYQQVYPALLRYHQWLYAERDPHNEGLVLQIHPYETGLDNSPPWINLLHGHSMPWWVSVLEKTKLDKAMTFMRYDTRHVSADERISNLDALLYFDIIRRLRRKAYNIDAVLEHSLFAVEDLSFNCILIRANEHLRTIAHGINKEIPKDLSLRMHKTNEAIEELWDAYASQYYSRSFTTHKYIKESSIAALMPLYAGVVTKERARQLVALLEDSSRYGTVYPIPSVPADSPWFKPHGYWQGPTWINMNWLIIDGLRRYGYDDHAAALTESTIELVQKAGCYEYFSPLDGTPAGAKNFSWTAALTIDLLRQSQLDISNIPL